MAIHTTDAIILKKRDVRETSLLTIFYTRDFGKIKGIMKGIRGHRGPLGYQVQVFTLNKTVFYDTKKTDIHTISQCDLLDFFEAVRGDIIKTSYAYYFVELVDTLTEYGEKNSEIFELLLNSLELLKGRAGPERTARILEIKLLMLIGLIPRFNKCISCDERLNFRKPSFDNVRLSYNAGGLLCGKCLRQDGNSQRILAGTANFIDHVERAPREKTVRIKTSKDVGKEVEKIMGNFLTYQFNVKFKSLEFINKIA
ncbi:MAG: DNA repair protein RecO [Candidatus Omnitrophota bacterium]|nr:DNA repair protein RecO [Candidatus Omnitrophota bacterium]